MITSMSVVSVSTCTYVIRHVYTAMLPCTTILIIYTTWFSIPKRYRVATRCSYGGSRGSPTPWDSSSRSSYTIWEIQLEIHKTFRNPKSQNTYKIGYSRFRPFMSSIIIFWNGTLVHHDGFCVGVGYPGGSSFWHNEGNCCPKHRLVVLK